MPPDMAPPRGIATQPSMSATLMRAETIAPGSKIWAEDDERVWILTEVIRQDNTILTVRDKTGQEIEIDLGFAETYPENPKVVSDMTSMHHIHEAGILYNLGERSRIRDQRPYTFMGTILIAVNPLQRIPDPDMSEYMDKALNPEKPHPFAIAELAYHQMRLGAGRRATNQSIVVSGESGAGKTETSKIMLSFLTHRSVGGVLGLEQKVVDSSPILESFGNAKTLRNNNSSRFGKFLKLQFTRDKYRLAGAFIETYLLEKSRVLSQGQGERNFHILYELVAGGRTSRLASKLKLKDVETYRILAQSNCTTLEGVDDAEQFRGVQRAFDTIGIDADSQMQVWQILASVLHLSNLQFDKVDHVQGEVASIADREALATLSELLGVEEDVLEAMLTQRVVTTRKEVFTKQLSAPDADLTRDAIVKSLYEAMFLWIVQVINKSLGRGEDSLPFIGVLDIFGFENFDTKNEFEQLLINFTNESLQDTFNKHVFNNELQLYEDEGIEVKVSTCPDNAECLKLLVDKPNGIIPSLNNVCEEPNASDDRYLSSLHKKYSRHQDFPRTAPKDMRECFWVKHYAGKVKYTVEGWVERNMDRVPESFNATLQSSKHNVVKEATAEYGKAPAAAVGGRRGSRKSLVKPTVAKAFLKSMQDLNDTLLSTMCNFVRCIKPNAEMKCGVYNNRYVVDQLQCLGILQTCEVLKVGMPTRVTYTELKEVLGDNAADAERLFHGEPETALIAGILWAFEVPPEAFRLGRTRVFFRAGQISTLQRILNETSADKGPWIFERLQEALANRQRAKADAAEAQAAVASVETAVTEALEEAKKVLGEDDEDDDEDSSSHRPPPPPVVTDDELYDLESAAKKAKKAASTTPQVRAFIQASEEDEIGKYAKGAMEKLMAASVDTFQAINDARTRAEELEKEISTARGSDAAGSIRRLENAVRRLKTMFQEAKALAIGAEEAAAKCKVEQTEELMQQAKQKVAAVASQSKSVSNGAKGVAQASEEQLAALAKANGMLAGCTAATEKALAALSSFKQLVADTSAEETKAREAADAQAAREAEEQRAADEKAKQEAAALKAAQEEEEMVDLQPSAAPPRGSRRDLMKKMPSQSVKNLLNTVSTPDTSVSPARKKADDGNNLDHLNPTGPQMGAGGVGQRAFQDMFREAMQGGSLEGHLMKQSKYFSQWKPRYFRLEDGFLLYYDKKSLVGTHKNKGMELTAHSITSYTNTKNCFCVRTGQTVWFLLAKDEASMNKWMTAINAQIHGLFIKLYNVPEDNYWGQGLKGRFFYRMVDDSLPQWIRTYPEEAAPRTGDGLFPGEVIEVTQVLSNKDAVFLRIANDRGWTYAHNPGDQSVLFEEISGEVADDHRNYGFPPTAKDPVPILFGPGLESQQTGEALIPGERAEATERFTPSDGSGVVFIKLADGRGWVPVRKRNGSFGVTPSPS